MGGARAAAAPAEVAEGACSIADAAEDSVSFVPYPFRGPSKSSGLRLHHSTLRHSLLALAAVSARILPAAPTRVRA